MGMHNLTVDTGHGDPSSKQKVVTEEAGQASYGHVFAMCQSPTSEVGSP
jgi:hypothetical protein